MNISLTTRLYNTTSSTPFLTPKDEEDLSDVRQIFDAIKIWVPIALTLLLVLLLCFVTIRSKAKRRREREAGTSDPMCTISGGVPTNVNAYRNYGVYIQRQQQQQTGGGVPCGLTPQEALRNLSYTEAPPSYEAAMKQTGIINASFSQSQENIATMPPPYPTEPSQSGSGQSSSDKPEAADSNTTNVATPNEGASSDSI